MVRLDKEAVREILVRRFEKDCHTKLSLIPSPFLFKDIKKAALRVKEAIEKKQKIVIVGDYDVDGVVSSVILSEFFDDVGILHEVEIPNRFSDGYGLNPSILDRVKADIVITVDNGISAVEAATICKQRGIDLIITDHHTPPQILPDAYAIVNPKQEDCTFPNPEICGAQVAWYFIAAIKEVCELEYDLSKHLDLLAIAIIADMMELKDINRVMVKRGLPLLNCSKRPAFMAIKEIFGKNCFESEDISFLISPLLNSAGRMEDAMFSFQFIKSKSKREAIARLEEIVEINNRRKDEERVLFESSLEKIEENDSIIVVWGEEWHEGVVGIVASRLSKRFKKPAIVFSLNEDRAKGSARSVAGVDILSLVSKHEELLLSFGGHFGAAGISLLKENLNIFKHEIISSMDCYEIDEDLVGEDVLGELEIDAIDFELLEILEYFEPYGQKNPKPNFVLKNMHVKVDKFIGKDERHKKLILQDDDEKSVEALFFNYDVDVKRGDTIDIVFYVSKNSFRGLVTPQLLIKEVLHVTSE
ncbi:MAG: single-stranded-DNA-specific exonuclease RecJ [Campylobacteraceae bacterium]